MAIAIYPEHALRQPECALLSRPVIPIPKCWEAELRPLTALAGMLDRLPVGEVQAALLLAGTAEGAKLKEVNAPGYERQSVEFHLHEAGRRTNNIHPVVFRFDEQPGSNLPLIGLFVDYRLVMRGGLTRVLVPPEGVNLSEPQVRLEGGAMKHPVSAAREMRRTSLQWTGIPTCVGLGPAKTLAKLANWAAKRLPELEGVCDFTSAYVRDEAMASIPAAEVWGVGSASARRLAGAGVETAAQLRDMDPRQARKLLTVVGERLAWELRGQSCLPLELLPPQRKGIAVTRCFGRMVTTLDEGLEAIRSYAARAGEKLRQHGVAGAHLYVGTSAWRLPSTAPTCRSIALAQPFALSSPPTIR